MKRAIILIFALMLGASVVHAQDYGSIHGTVKDKEGTPLPGVTVTISSAYLGDKALLTSETGAFRFPGIPIASDYALKFEFQGFYPVIRELISVAFGEDAGLDIVMEQAAIKEEVPKEIENTAVDVKGKKLYFFFSGTTLGIMKDARPYNFYGVLPPPVPDRYSDQAPGTLENATSYDFPVQYWPIDISADPSGPRNKTPRQDLLDRLIESGKELENQGVKLISTDCGFYAYYQDEVANALNVPFASGALLAVPLVSRIIGSNRRVGIITFDSRFLTKKHLAGAGIDDSIKYAIIGYETYFKKWQDEGKRGKAVFNLQMLEADLIDATKKLISEYPDIGAIVLECTGFGPAGYSIQKATGLPVFDVVQLLNYLGKACVRSTPN